MKIRTDFVTNSSSSSFIVQVKKPKQLSTNPFVVKEIKDLYESFLKVLGADALIHNEDEMNEFFVNEYGLDPDDVVMDELGDIGVFIKEGIEADCVIAYTSVEYGSEERFEDSTKDNKFIRSVTSFN